MRKIAVFTLLVALVSASASATYIVVLRNGTVYKARAKWTVVNGKALIQPENGPPLQVDVRDIDELRSEQATRAGLGGAKALPNANTESAAATPREQAPSLGAGIHLRKVPESNAAQATPAIPSNGAPQPAAGGMLSQEVVDKFARAYENVGLFEQSLKAIGPTTLHAELTADTEDKVFNAISATSFLMVRNAGVTGARIDQVELFMKTTNGGAAGRFQMSRADAEMLDGKKITQQEYFVRHVIY